jgi:hypothetical protein
LQEEMEQFDRELAIEAKKNIPIGAKENETCLL